MHNGRTGQSLIFKSAYHPANRFCEPDDKRQQTIINFLAPPLSAILNTYDIFPLGNSLSTYKRNIRYAHSLDMIYVMRILDCCAQF